MRVIITGGTGLIGRALAKNLAQQDGAEVILLSRSPEKADKLPQNVRAEKWDGRSANGWGHLAEGAAAIVNLAGAGIAGDGLIPSRWTKQRKAILIQSRVDAGKAVTEAITAATQKPQVLIQASAVGYYGTHDAEIITEEHPAGTDFLARAVCTPWEESTQSVEDQGVRRCIIRTGLVLDPNDGVLPLLALPVKLFVGGPMGSGRQQMPWIHIDDHIAAIRFLINRTDAQGPYNLNAPNPVTNADFVGTLGRVLGRPTVIPVPTFALNLALGEMAIIVTEGQRTVPERLLNDGFQFAYTDLETALRQLYA